MSAAPSDNLAVRQIAASFAAEVRGMPIHGDVHPALLARFASLLHSYRVLVVPGLQLDPADLVAFSRRFGALEIHASFDHTHPAHREIFCVGNVERDGLRASFSQGVEQWHADSSFRAVSSDASLFYGEIVPPEGGDTLFADATAAYAALPKPMQKRIVGLRAVHSLETLHEGGRVHNPGRPAFSAEKRAAWPPVAQDLVRTHPVTGSKSLYLCPAVISHIDGMDPASGRALIEELMAHTAQARFVYAHRWQHGDLVMWDNRAVLHTASLFDHTRYQRLMYRTTVAGNEMARLG